jgi:hypothetical protein
MPEDPHVEHTRYLRDEALLAELAYVIGEGTETARDEARRLLWAHLEDERGLDPSSDYVGEIMDSARVQGPHEALDATASVGLGVQALQVYKSLSDAGKELMDQPQPQEGTGMSEVARDQIEKLQEDLRRERAKPKQIERLDRLIWKASVHTSRRATRGGDGMDFKTTVTQEQPQRARSRCLDPCRHRL